MVSTSRGPDGRPSNEKKPSGRQWAQREKENETDDEELGGTGEKLERGKKAKKMKFSPWDDELKRTDSSEVPRNPPPPTNQLRRR